MRIAEIFYSLQGEGINAGKKAIFVRFFGCNLACTWCDTKYSWHPQYASWKELSLAVVIKKIQSFPCTHVIFTGGEPALFQKEIRQIVSALPKDFTYEIESNGTISLAPIAALLTVVNISPKLKNSGNPSQIKALDERYFYKFVVMDESDVPEILELVKKYDLQKVLLMPEGKTRAQQLKQSAKIEELCQKYGFQFSPRLQALLWNGKKGK